MLPLEERAPGAPPGSTNDTVLNIFIHSETPFKLARTKSTGNGYLISTTFAIGI